MLPVDLFWCAEDGWVVKTPVKLSLRALEDAREKTLLFYERLVSDMPESSPKYEELIQAVLDLRAGRITQSTVLSDVPLLKGT